MKIVAQEKKKSSTFLNDTRTEKFVQEMEKSESRLTFQSCSLILNGHVTKKMANLSASPIFLTHEATQQKRDSVYHNQLGPRPRQRLEATKVATENLV